MVLWKGVLMFTMILFWILCLGFLHANGCFSLFIFVSFRLVCSLQGLDMHGSVLSSLSFSNTCFYSGWNHSLQHCELSALRGLRSHRDFDSIIWKVIQLFYLTLKYRVSTEALCFPTFSIYHLIYCQRSHLLITWPLPSILCTYLHEILMIATFLFLQVPRLCMQAPSALFDRKVVYFSLISSLLLPRGCHRDYLVCFVKFLQPQPWCMLTVFTISTSQELAEEWLAEWQRSQKYIACSQMTEVHCYEPHFLLNKPRYQIY